MSAARGHGSVVSGTEPYEAVTPCPCGLTPLRPESRLSRLLLQVTLIDQSERFVFKPLLYDFVAGTAKAWEVAPYFQQLLAPYNINFLQARLSMKAATARPRRRETKATLGAGWLEPSLGNHCKQRCVQNRPLMWVPVTVTTM